METIIQIKQENLQELYKTLTNYPTISKEQVIHEMHKAFGEKAFRPQDVRERVKTFEDAIEELGKEHPLVLHYSFNFNEEGSWNDDGYVNDLEAYLKLRIICAALNEGWEPKFTEKEERWYPWFWLLTQDEINEMKEEEKTKRQLRMITGEFRTEYAGLVFAYSSSAPSLTSTYIGSRLCFQNEALAKYAGTQFIDIWKDFLLIRE